MGRPEAQAKQPEAAPIPARFCHLINPLFEDKIARRQIELSQWLLHAGWPEAWLSQMSCAAVGLEEESLFSEGSMQRNFCSRTQLLKYCKPDARRPAP